MDRLRRVKLAVPGAYSPRTDRIHHIHVPGLDRPGLVGEASPRSAPLHAVAWNLVTAATVFAIAPVIVVFFFAQKAFVQGVTLTGVKG